ncbi:hypothetical protein BH24CHL6_BH24CHL6_12680 [soil metagenome]
MRGVSRALRNARIAAGLSQAELGAPVGVSRATVSRCETGRYSRTTALLLARLLRVLGLELRFSAYPVGNPLRDAGHVRLTGRILLEIRPPLTYRAEVPFPNAGDLRAWDIVLRLERRRVALEAETRLHDLQQLVRRTYSKRRDGLVDGLVIVIADTRHNRDMLPALESLLPDYPRLSGARFLRMLNEGRLPPDGIVLL